MILFIVLVCSFINDGVGLYDSIKEIYFFLLPKGL